ncbi:FtsK/SpoIIIE domain-containing protein [Enterococcus sp. LJL51]|uniref:FtsK/SpoIIIE domain-containing protein n=1 Tax=Enterococcus sp. LJL51 TaxID=3416656 RepID=UPI003CE6CDF9
MNKLIVYRGKRIRMFHRKLLFKYGIAICIPFFIMLGVYHFFVTYPLVEKMESSFSVQPFILPVLITVAVISCSIFLAFYIIRSSQLRGGFFNRQYKKQQLAEYLDDNDLIIRKTKKTEKGQKEVRKFPKIYYRANGDTDEFTFKIGNKFQDKFLQIGRPLEDMYLADLTAVKREQGYVTFCYLIDVQSKRIKFEELAAGDGKVQFMKGVWWEYDSLPHMLITGGTGGGKTYFIYSLIAALGKEGRVHISDPKNADLADLANFKAFKGLVVSDKKEIFKQMQEAVELMDKRFLYMKKQPNYTIGKNYRYYGMKPEFFIVDEWAAFISVLDKFGRDENACTEEKLYESISPLVLKARQAGVFFILATQKAGTDVIRSAIRDNLMCKVSLGRLSEQGYIMTFGDDNKNKSFINKYGVHGRGYIDVGAGVPQEFYSPLVDPKFDFVEYFKNMPAMPYTDVSDVEVTEEDIEILEEVYGDNFIESEKEEIAKKSEEQRLEQAKEKNEKAEELMEAAGFSYTDQVKMRQKEVV